VTSNCVHRLHCRHRWALKNPWGDDFHHTWITVFYDIFKRKRFKTKFVEKRTLFGKKIVCIFFWPNQQFMKQDVKTCKEIRRRQQISKKWWLKLFAIQKAIQYIM
jgi:hypothetical protein